MKPSKETYQTPSLMVIGAIDEITKATGAAGGDFFGGTDINVGSGGP